MCTGFFEAVNQLPGLPASSESSRPRHDVSKVPDKVMKRDTLQGQFVKVENYYDSSITLTLHQFTHPRYSTVATMIDRSWESTMS